MRIRPELWFCVVVGIAALGCRNANDDAFGSSASGSAAQVVASAAPRTSGASASLIDNPDVCTDTAAPPVPAAVRTFYIDAARGDDNSDGRTLRSAWRTLGKANAAAQPGDLFLLTGHFNNQYIRPNLSGTATRKIVYRTLPGASAVLDHGQYDVIIWLDDRRHVVVDGLEIQNELYSILVRGGADHIWLRNLSVHDVGTAVQFLKSSDNRIENSTFERCGDAKANAGDCIWIADGSSRNVIARNTITNAGHGTIFIGGDKVGMAPSEDNIVAYNDLSNPWAANVGLIGFARRTTIECNRIHDSSTSGVNYARTGLQITADENTIRYNEIYANTSDGIQLQAYNFQGMTQNSTANQIYNNTVWGNGGAALQLLQKDLGSVKDNVIQNNIFWGNNTSPNAEASRYYNGSHQQVWIDLYNANSVWSPASLNGNTIRNNIIARNANDRGKGWLIIVRPAANGSNAYYSMQQAQTSLAGVSGNLQTDPHFANARSFDFHLLANSPAARVGLPIANLKRSNPSDLGAHSLR